MNYYKKIRVIIVNNEQSTNETVIFTEDFDTIAIDYCMKGQEVTSDDVILGMILPDSFPMDYELNRS